jgi:hypothetical protein
MAEIHGSGGSMGFTGITVGIKKWTLSVNCDMLEITDFDDVDGAADKWKEFMAGLKSWTVTAEGNYDNANTAMPGDSAALTLQLTAALGFSGTGLFQTMGTGSDVQETSQMSYTFQGTGALTPDTIA